MSPSPSSSSSPPQTVPHPLPPPLNTYTLHEAPPTALPSFVNIFNQAFAHDPLFVAMRGSADPEKLRASDEARWAKDWGREGRRYFMVLDGEGQIAAISKWWFPHQPAPEQSAAEETAAATVAKVPDDAVPGANAALNDEFFGLLTRNREKWIVKEDMYFMNILAVHPSHQRLGLGAALLSPILRQADAEGRRCYIEASPAGLGLYRKMGWRECGDVIRLDLRDYGVQVAEGEEAWVQTVLMVREPGGGGAVGV